MRFSIIAALSAAPLALAGTMQQVNHNVQPAPAIEVVQHEAVQPVHQAVQPVHEVAPAVHVNQKQAKHVDEVIVIWVNQGGGAATSTVTKTVTVTGASGVHVAAATHSVSLEIEKSSTAFN